MIGFNGGLIGKDRTPTALAAIGVWTLDEQIKARRSGAWPELEDPDASAYITAVETADAEALEAATKAAIQTFVKGCKADGIWSAIKASCILAGARTLTGALVPLVGTAPTNSNFAAGDYNRKTGLVGNGSTKRLDSNRAADIGQDNNHLAIYGSTVGGGNLIGHRNGAASGLGDTTIMHAEVADFPLRSRISSFATTAQTGTRATTVTGFIGISRSSSTGYTSRLSGTDASITSTSAAPAAWSYGVFARNDNGAYSGFSTSRLAFYSIGESLNLALLDTRVTDLITAIAAAF
jgi:hypothetical protein